MKRLLSLVSAIAALVAVAPAAARAANSTAILRETARIVESGGPRIANFWWLPIEYWQECARELALPEEERAKIEPMLRDYILVAALDAKVSAEKKGADLATTGDMVAHAKFYRNGEQVEVLREVAPGVPELLPKLVYLLRSSLGPLGEGLHVLPLPNVDAKGNRILTGASTGELKLEYRFDDSGPVQTLYWHAPFTAIAGPKTCPKGGEPLEASFEFCPWHGVKVPSKR